MGIFSTLSINPNVTHPYQGLRAAGTRKFLGSSGRPGVDLNSNMRIFQRVGAAEKALLLNYLADRI